MEGREGDHAALMRAHGLRPGDPLMLLNVRYAARGGRPTAVRPQDAAAALLADAGALRTGAILSLALDLPLDAAMPTAFRIPSAGSEAAAWSTAPPPPAKAREGCRRIRFSARTTPLSIDWAASLSARTAGREGAVHLLAGTAIAALRAHDPALPRSLGREGLAALAEASPTLDPRALLWSVAEMPAAALGNLARESGIRMAPAPMPAGIAACLAAGDPEGLALVGDRAALADAYRAGSAVRAILAIPPGMDLRALGVPGGIAALAALASAAGAAARP